MLFWRSETLQMAIFINLVTFQEKLWKPRWRFTTLTSQIPHNTWWESEVKTVFQAGHANIISSTPKPSDVGKLRCETTLMFLTPPAASEMKWQHKPFLWIHLSRSSVFSGSNITSAISTVITTLAFNLGNQTNAYWTPRSPKTPGRNRFCPAQPVLV